MVKFFTMKQWKNNFSRNYNLTLVIRKKIYTSYFPLAMPINLWFYHTLLEKNSAQEKYQLFKSKDSSLLLSHYLR